MDNIKDKVEKIKVAPIANILRIEIPRELRKQLLAELTAASMAIGDGSEVLKTIKQKIQAALPTKPPSP